MGSFLVDRCCVCVSTKLTTTLSATTDEMSKLTERGYSIAATISVGPEIRHRCNGVLGVVLVATTEHFRELLFSSTLVASIEPPPIVY